MSTFALVTDLRTGSFAEESVRCTITQQLAKNTLFTQEKAFAPQGMEMFAAPSPLEKQYNKEQIF